MMSETLRGLIESAASAISTYKNPDISECCERLDQILIAAKLGSIEYERVTYLAISRGSVVMHTEYSIRGCEQSDSYEFPEAIIDAADTIKAATLWGLERRIAEVKGETDNARRTLSNREAELAELSAALALERSK